VGGGVYFMNKAKQDIVECVVQLGKRAQDLGYNPLAATLFVVAGTSYEGENSEKMVAALLQAYAESRLKQLNGRADEGDEG